MEGATQLAVKPKPETSWDAEGGNYKGAEGATRGVLGIIDMLMEDLEKEIASARQDEADAQADYEKDMLDLTRTYRASERAQIKAETQLADLKGDKSDVNKFKEAKEK